MKKFILFTLMILIILSNLTTATVNTEVRGSVAGIINQESNLIDGTYVWTPQNFAGFYYNLNDDLGNEQIAIQIEDNTKLQEPFGIIYTTSVQNKPF
jgi:hypothetical protein